MTKYIRMNDLHWVTRFLFFMLPLIIFNCTKEQKNESTEKTQQTNTVKNVSFSIPELTEQDLKRLFQLQIDIVKNPDNINFRQNFIANAFFPEKKTLITFGVARLPNDKMQNTPGPLVRRTTLVDARRWAAYGISWIKNNYQPNFGKLNTTINGNIQQLGSFRSGDSLIVGYASEVQ